MHGPRFSPTYQPVRCEPSQDRMSGLRGDARHGEPFGSPGLWTHKAKAVVFLVGRRRQREAAAQARRFGAPLLSWRERAVEAVVIEGLSQGAAATAVFKTLARSILEVAGDLRVPWVLLAAKLPDFRGLGNGCKRLGLSRASVGCYVRAWQTGAESLAAGQSMGHPRKLRLPEHLAALRESLANRTARLAWKSWSRFTSSSGATGWPAG